MYVKLEPNSWIYARKRSCVFQLPAKPVTNSRISEEKWTYKQSLLSLSHPRHFLTLNRVAWATHLTGLTRLMGVIIKFKKRKDAKTATSPSSAGKTPERSPLISFCHEVMQMLSLTQTVISIGSRFPAGGFPKNALSHCRPKLPSPVWHCIMLSHWHVI